MRQVLPVPATILTLVILIVGCSDGDDTADEATVSSPATTVAPAVTVAAPATTAGPDMTTLPETAEPSPGSLTIMPIGDSITQPRASWCTYRWNLDAMLNDAGVAFDLVGSQSEPHPFGSYGCSTAFDMDHESYWGGTIEGVGSNAIPSVETLQPDVALVHLGSNNLGQSPAAAADELESFIIGLQSVSPDITIFVAQVIPCDPGPVPEFGVKCAENLPAFNDLIASFTSLSTDESSVIVVDMETDFSLSDLRDKSHPSDAGDEVIANRWMEAMQAAGLI